jgi:hypothetical protein
MKVLAFPNEYSAAGNWLEQNGDGFSVLLAPPYDAGVWKWFPSSQNNMPSSVYPAFNNPLYQFPPTGVQTLGWGAETPNRLAFFAINELYLNRTENIGKILGLLGIKYIVLQSDEYDVSQQWDPSLYTFQNTKSLLTSVIPRILGLTEVWHNGSITIFQNNFALPLLFSSTSFAVADGDMRVINELASQADYNLSSLPFAFLPDLGSAAIMATSQAGLLILDGSNWNNFEISSIPPQYVVNIPLQASPSTSHERQIADTSWVDSVHAESFDWGRPFVAEGPVSYPGSWIMSAGSNASTSMPFSIQNWENYSLWANLYLGPITQSGFDQVQSQLSMEIDGRLIWRNETLVSGSQFGGFHWVNIGNLSLTAGQHELRLTNVRGFNFVQRLVLVARNGLLYARAALQAQSPSKPVLIILNPGSLYATASNVVLEAEDFVGPQSPGWYFSNSPAYGSFSGRGWAGSSVNGSALTLQFYVASPSNYTLVSRGLGASDKGAISYLVDDKPLGQINWHVSASNSWTNRTVGDVFLNRGYHQLTLLPLQFSNQSSFAVAQDRLTFTEFPGSPSFVQDFTSSYGYSMRVTNSTLSLPFQTLTSGGYSFAFRVKGFANLTAAVDGVLTYDGTLRGANFSTEYGNPLLMPKGNHTILMNIKGSLNIDQLLIFGGSNGTYNNLGSFLRNISVGLPTNYSKADSSEYTAIRPTKGTLVFLQSYDSLWESTSGHSTIQSIRMFGYANGFVGAPAELNVHYQLFRFQYYGALASGLLLIGSLLVAIVPYLRTRVFPFLREKKKRPGSPEDSTRNISR